MKRRAFLTALPALALAGCSSWEVIQAQSPPYEDETFRIQLPPGWVRALFEQEAVALTRDGHYLELIYVQRKPHAKAFKRIKKQASAELLPSELAELALSEQKAADPALATTVVLSNQPAMLGERLGFRLHLRFTTPKGLPMEQLLYGVCDAKYYYAMGFQAPSFHYFPTYEPDFERMVRSFKLLAPPST